MEAAWASEIERRAREALANPDDDVAWETVRAGLGHFSRASKSECDCSEFRRRRKSGAHDAPDLRTTITAIAAFAEGPLAAAARGLPFGGHWLPGGPWGPRPDMTPEGGRLYSTYRFPLSRSCKVAIKIGSAIRSFGRPAFAFTAISVGRSSTRSWSPSSITHRVCASNSS